MKPVISILIPAFNAQEWIAETLCSAIAQTWEPKEIILVDDGSTDATLAVARRFESDCLRVFTQNNQGAAAARNRAFSLSRGEYIQWLDADDLLAHDKIARQMAVLDRCRSERTLLSSAWGKFFYRCSRTKFVESALWCDLSPAEWLVRKLGQNLQMPNLAWLVSRQLTEAAGPWDTSMFVDDDGEYFCRVLLQSDGIRFVPDAKVYYRASGSSSLSYIGASDKKLEAQWRSMQFQIASLRSLEDSTRIRAASVAYLQNWLLHFYPERPDIVQKVRESARELGHELALPRLSWKYAWIETVFGWGLAKRVQRSLRNMKWSVVRFWDKTLLRVERWRSSRSIQQTSAA